MRRDGGELAWLEERDRLRKGRGRHAITNHARQAFSYQALLSGVSWQDMDEGWTSPAESRLSPPSPNNISTPKSSPPIYGSSKADRHAQKVYALSKCVTVTLCDTWATIDRDARYHTHNILHNGKAHHLFPLVDTIRVIPLTSAHSNITPLCSAQENCPFIQEIAPKKLVHRNVTLNGFDLTSEPVDELVIFLPHDKWPEDSELTGMAARLEDRLATAEAKVIKLVLGPFLADKNRPEQHIQYGNGFRPEHRDRFHIPLGRLINVVRNACAQSTMVHIYGLENVRIPRNPDDDYDRFHAHLGPPRMWSYSDLLAILKANCSMTPTSTSCTIP